MPPVDKAKRTLRAFAPLIGISKSRVGQLRKEPWWPAGEAGWDPDACRAAIAANVGRAVGAGRYPAGSGAAPTPGLSPATSEPEPAKKRPAPPELLDALRDQEASPVVLAETMLRALSWRLAEGLATGALGSKDADDVKKALVEYRTAQTAQLELDRKAGRLVDRDAAAEAGSYLARQLREVLDQLESALVVEAERWRCDPTHRELSPDAAAAEVRRWYTSQVRRARADQTATIERILSGAA